jgi:hypothetical protein
LNSVFESADNNFTAGIKYTSLSLGLVFQPRAFIERAVGERAKAIALSQVLRELALIASTICVSVSALTVHKAVLIETFVIVSVCPMHAPSAIKLSTPALAMEHAAIIVFLRTPMQIA